MKKNARNARKMLEMLEILLPHSSSKLELPMNFNAIFENVEIIKIGLLDAKLQKKKFLRCPGESKEEEEGEGGEGGEHRDEKLFLEPPREFHSGG